MNNFFPPKETHECVCVCVFFILMLNLMKSLSLDTHIYASESERGGKRKQANDELFGSSSCLLAACLLLESILIQRNEMNVITCFIIIIFGGFSWNL